MARTELRGAWKLKASLQDPATPSREPRSGLEEDTMENIKVNDMNEETVISAEEMEHVKGGPAYLKLGDIKGEVVDRDHGKWIDILSVSNPVQR